MAFVDLNQFTKNIDTYESIVASLQAQLEVLAQANSTLRAGMTGVAAEALYAQCTQLQARVEENIQQIRKAIALVQSNNEYYVSSLGVLE